MSDTKMPEIRMPEMGRRDATPGIVWLGLGLVLGAVVGMAIALIAAPYPGQETRRRLGQQVDKMKRQGEDEIKMKRQGDEQIGQIHPAKSENGGTPAYTTPTPSYERSKPAPRANV